METKAPPRDVLILFEDEHLIVLDKPAGLVVHPAPGHPDGTLVNALLHHAVVAGGADPLRPGIVHRLDKDTSGVMVVAKTPLAHERLVVNECQANRVVFGGMGRPCDAAERGGAGGDCSALFEEVAASGILVVNRLRHKVGSA